MTVGAHTPVAAGHQLRGYTLRRFLAQGGMAELFLAQPTDPARSREVVVVKRVLPQFGQDLQFARMFAREAELASMLKHPNIVEVFGSEGTGEAECFFAMEYVHGPDLNMLLKVLKEGTRPVPLEHALQIAMGMCAGLHHAHEYRGADGQQLSIVHRDVSPSNVMIAADGTVKITDFGVAKALALTSFTQAGTRKGKLSYMSPEQAVADPVDRRTDIFAIGTVLFEMTTLQRMFGGENELAVMHKLLFRERPRPSAIRHDYPPELESILMRAVAQKPEDRFGSADEMYQALRTFAERRRLHSTPAHLARWVASIIPPKPHPGDDPSFYTGEETSVVIPIQRDTVVAADMQATTSDSALVGNATMLDGAGPMPIAGQLQSSAPTAHHAQPTSVAGLLAPTTSPGPMTTTVTRRPPPRSSTLPAVAIVAGALAVGAVIFAGALWYADARNNQAPNTPASEVTPAPSAVSPSAPAVTAPSELTPGLIEDEPAPQAPAAEPPKVAAEPPSTIRTADRPSVQPPEPSTEPVPAPTPKKPRTSKKRRPKPEPKAKPAPKPEPKPAPSPEPKPETNTKDVMKELFPDG